MDEPVHLTLYVTRACALSAAKNVLRALGNTKEDVAELKIVDVTIGSEQIECDNEFNLSAPCLKVERGDSEFFVTGDLSDIEQIEQALRGQRKH